eukprot:GHRR01012219.1.p1 GENE.GHRR01012219.1~~GHRR01012219.1.p1  ORF type:complete len:619 (+),score=253.43 GHRR01012219.1:499-2355(+)
MLCSYSRQTATHPWSSRSCRRVSCVQQAAASDEKSWTEPTYLSDLIAFETDAEGEPASPASSMSRPSLATGTSGSGSSLDAGQGDADPTQRAQEIINRATEVLAAARAALGPPDAAATSSSGSVDRLNQDSAAAAGPQRADESASRGSTPWAQTTDRQQQYQQQQQQYTQQPSPGSSPVGSQDGPTGSADSTDQLTRRWSQFSSDGQDLTRHVLQNALDEMQRSGAPIAAPQDGSSSSSSAGSAAGARGGVKSSRDLRSTTISSNSSSSKANSSSKASGTDGKAAVAGRDAGHAPAPGWAESLLGSGDFSSSQGYVFPSESSYIPQLQPQVQSAAAWPAALDFAEPPTITLPPVALNMVRQSVLDTQRAKQAVLPPLQSVVELTTAFKPPERTGQLTEAPIAATATETAAAPVGKSLADGSGRLADGTWWEKKSGIEYGKNGYWKCWQLLKGGNAEGTIEWEEAWWEASDWTGLKEMGAEKKGRNVDGAAWRESWTERLMYASNDLDCVVERNAHKWAAEATGDEWEEQWGEHYHASGKVAKYADKWGKQGPNVWHERWGEDYDSSIGDACVKWTDKWAERLLPGGAREQWGDKWHEAFANGRGEKNGEVSHLPSARF